MKKKANKILVILGGIALLTGLFLDFNDIKNVFTGHTDISGEWYFEFHTKESTYNDYINSTTEYKIHLLQDNERIEGSGETWKYNGELLPYSKHDPLDIEGTFKKGVLFFTYKLKGSLRETQAVLKHNIKKVN